ncbi:hypothetical protein GKODMF_01045 [Candidatus Electrothrix gigas]
MQGAYIFFVPHGLSDDNEFYILLSFPNKKEVALIRLFFGINWLYSLVVVAIVVILFLTR